MNENQNTLTLFQLSAEMAAIEAALIENGGELTPELETAMAETSEGLQRKADGYGILLAKFAAVSDACKAEIDRIQNIKKTADNSVKRIKGHLAETMRAFEMKHLDGETHKFTLTQSTGTVIDEDAVLRPYEEKIAKFQDTLPAWLTVKASISKTALKDAFKDSEVKPEGVDFVDNYTVRVR